MIKKSFCDYNPYDKVEYYDKSDSDLRSMKHQNSLYEFDDSIRSDLPPIEDVKDKAERKDDLKKDAKKDEL